MKKIDLNDVLRLARLGEDELSGLLDRVDQRMEKLREFILPPHWESEKERLMQLGIKPPLLRLPRR